MTTWNAGLTDKVSVGFVDATGQRKTTFFEVDAAASDANIQTLIAAMQDVSDMSIQEYAREKKQVGSGYPAAQPLGSGHQYALLTMALQANESCGADEVNTRLSVLGPKETNIIKVARDKAGLDPASSAFSTLEGAAQAVQVNTAGTLVLSIIGTQIQTRKNKSRLM
jgi:hypothetical protein